MHTSNLIGPVLELRHRRSKRPSAAPRLVIQKYGGTLLRSPEGRATVVDQVRRTRASGHPGVVVASAMGRAGEPYATDSLLRLATDIDPSVDPRTQDLLASCGEVISTALMAHLLNHAGVPSVALTGGDAGIVTDDHFGDASIISVQPLRLLRALRARQTPVVAGFQGRTRTGDVTTLGRGGSDITAVALGAALGAGVEIFKDVEGLMTADPAIVPSARRIPSLSYADAASAGWLGARVLHPRATEMALAQRVQVWVGPLLASRSAGTDLCDTCDGAIMVVSAAAVAPDVPARGGWVRVSAVGSGLRQVPDAALLGDEALHRAGVSAVRTEAAIAGTAISWRVPLEATQLATRALHSALVEQRPRVEDRLPALAIA